VTLDKRFLLLNNITWHKTTNRAQAYAVNNRCWTTCSERILFYSAQYDPTGWETVHLDVNNFVPLREYFYRLLCFMGESNGAVSERLGHRRAEHAFYVLPKSQVIEQVGQNADHCFRYGSTQWDLPTLETYQELIAVYGIDKWEGYREYEALRREYEALRRVFNATAKTLDVITGATVAAADNSEHPTTKPLWLMKRLIEVSTNQGDTVLDCCMGSGTTIVACVQTGRNGIGIELDPGYFAISEKRIAEAQLQVRMNI